MSHNPLVGLVAFESVIYIKINPIKKKPNNNIAPYAIIKDSYVYSNTIYWFRVPKMF